MIAVWSCVPATGWSSAPFVHASPPRISDQIATSRAAVIARAVAGADREKSWTIARILNDSTGTVTVGTRIQPRPAPPDDAKLVLLVAYADRTVAVTPIAEATVRYLASLPAVDAAAETRFRYACQHVASSDPTIAGDAFAEMAAIDLAAIKAWRNLLPVDAIRQSIDDPRSSGERLGLYGFLLGLCGTPEDADSLRKRFLEAEGLPSGADGLAAGYLLLAGEAGLAALESDVFETSTLSPLLAASLFDALQFFREQDAGPFTRERLRQAACRGFARPDTADLAVGYLVAGREWEALPRVVDLLDAGDVDPTRKRALQVTAVRYLLECRRDVDTLPAHRVLATDALTRINSIDPDLIRRATHLAGAPDDLR